MGATKTGALTGAAAANPYVAAGAAGFELINGLQQAELIRKQGDLANRIAEMNAQYAEQDAWNAEVDGFGQVARYEHQIDDVLADQKATYAAKNVDINFGTAKEVQKETKLTGFLNTLDIKNQAHEKAMGYTREARNIRLQGAMNQGQTALRASATQSAAVVGAASSYAGYLTK